MLGCFGLRQGGGVGREKVWSGNQGGALLRERISVAVEYIRFAILAGSSVPHSLYFQQGCISMISLPDKHET